MFYIKHSSENFTIIDCNLLEERETEILNELKAQCGSRMRRFISTHPDEDHILGIEQIDKNNLIWNFYCVENETIKENPTESFEHYCKLKDQAFYLKKGISLKWLNEYDSSRGSSGINILWPITNNEYYLNELEKVKKGNSPNNIGPIIKYSLQNSVKCLWMGDLEKNFINNVKDEIDWPEVDILFAPHHGRKTGKLPKEILDKINPLLVIIGEAKSEDIDYEYYDYDYVTQNSAEDILLECSSNRVSVYVSNKNYADIKSVKKFENMGYMYLHKELIVNDKSIKIANKYRVENNRKKHLIID